MKAIKKINNNVAVCVDNDDRQLIAFGKGIGFPVMPYTISDLSLITQTFYDVDEKFLPLLKEIPHDIQDVTVQIIETARKRLSTELNPNVIVTLADHLNFCVVRLKRNMRVRLPAIYDLRKRYPIEVEIARMALDLLEKRLDLSFKEDEITGIALALINAEMENNPSRENYDEENLTDKIADIIESHFQIKLDAHDMNYTRFVNHMRALYDRLENRDTAKYENPQLYAQMKAENPELIQCIEKIIALLQPLWDTQIDIGEQINLFLQLNRLVVRARNEAQGARMKK